MRATKVAVEIRNRRSQQKIKFSNNQAALTRYWPEVVSAKIIFALYGGH